MSKKYACRAPWRSLFVAVLVDNFQLTLEAQNVANAAAKRVRQTFRRSGIYSFEYLSKKPNSKKVAKELPHSQ